MAGRRAEGEAARPRMSPVRTSRQACAPRGAGVRAARTLRVGFVAAGAP